MPESPSTASSSGPAGFLQSPCGKALLAAAALLLPLLILRESAGPPAPRERDVVRERFAVALFNPADAADLKQAPLAGALESYFRKSGYRFEAAFANALSPARHGGAAVYLLPLADAPLPARLALPLRDFLIAEALDGAKVIMLGNPTAFYDALGSFNEYNRLLNLCGAEDRGDFTAVTGEVAVDFHPAFFPDCTSAEVRAQVTFMRRLGPVSSREVALVEARCPDRRFTPVLVGPRGGLAMNPMLFLKRGDAWRPALHLPAFLDAALSGETPPRAPDPAVRPVKRRALVLFSSRTYGYRSNLFRRFAQLPLNLLGYDFEYLDTAGMTAIRPARRHDLIITAYLAPNHANYDAVLRFLLESDASKYIFLQNLPVYDERGECPDWPLVVQFFQKFHVRFDGYEKYDAKVGLEPSGDGLYPFESTFSTTAETAFGRLIPLHDHKPILSFRTDRALYTPAFMDGRALFLIGDLIFDWRNDHTYLDLYEAFRRHLDPPAIPHWQFGHGPRLFFAHIDGDGLFNSHESTPHILGGERVYALLSENPMPCSASFIVREILADHGGRPASLELAKRIAALPNVEAVSHTLFHPLHWTARTAEVSEYEGGEVREDAYALAMVRDPKAEIEDSVAWIGRLFPGAPRLLFWSGDCMPSEAQLRRARLAGIRAMNGGDTRYDDEKPGITHVAPPYGRIGGEVQVHTGAANEMPFTNLWDGPHDGFAKVAETLERTGAGRVLTPANIYYHFYSGESEIAFAALKAVYAWAATKELAPVFASEYVDLVHDWIDCRLETGSAEVRLFNDGHLRALRVFRHKVDGVPDLARSEGLLGFEEHPDSFLLHLDDSTRHIARFSTDPSDAIPHIRRATHRAKRMPGPEGATAWRFGGHGPFRAVLAGLDPNTPHRVERFGDGIPFESFVTSGSDTVELTGVIRGEFEVTLAPVVR